MLLNILCLFKIKIAVGLSYQLPNPTQIWFLLRHYMHVFKAYNCMCTGTFTLKVINNGGRSKEDTVHRCDTK